MFSGTYQERIHIAHKNIDIVGQGMEETIIDGELLGRTVSLEWSNSLIEGFTITGGYNSSLNGEWNVFMGGQMQLFLIASSCFNWDGHLGIGNTDNAKFLNCMFLDHYEEAHPIYIDNGKRGEILLTV